MLYLLQFWQLIDIDLLIILLPVIVASAFIALIMLLATAIALIFRSRKDRG